MTPTPPAIAPDKRNLLIQKLRVRQTTISDEVADMLKADGVALAAAQAEIARKEDVIEKYKAGHVRRVDINTQLQSVIADRDHWRAVAQSGSKTYAKAHDRAIKAESEIARLTAALATAREDGMREAAKSLGALIKDEWDEGTNFRSPNRCHLTVRENMGVRAARNYIESSIVKEPHHGGATGGGTGC